MTFQIQALFREFKDLNEPWLYYGKQIVVKIRNPSEKCSFLTEVKSSVSLPTQIHGIFKQLKVQYSARLLLTLQYSLRVKLITM